MKKKVFAFLYLAVTLALAVSAIAVHAGNRSKWPVTQEAYEKMMKTPLDSWDGVKEIAGTADLVFRPYLIRTDTESIVRTENNMLTPFHSSLDFDMDQAMERFAALKEYCDELGIPLLYVSYPSKATYTEHDGKDYGIASVDKETRAVFLERIRELGIPVLDVSGILKGRGFSMDDVFYRTDHHWKTRMALIAAEEIAGLLQEYVPDGIHPEMLEEDRFRSSEYGYQWLGETGRKVSSVWSGTLDGYVLYEPDYDISYGYYVPSARISEERTFSDLVDLEKFGKAPDLYRESMHYVYLKDAGPVTQFRNRNMSGAKILLIQDSYSVPAASFLAAATGDLFMWDMREMKESVFAYIDKHRFDAVVVAYTDFWRDEMYDFR